MFLNFPNQPSFHVWIELLLQLLSFHIIYQNTQLGVGIWILGVPTASQNRTTYYVTNTSVLSMEDNMWCVTN